MGVYMALVTVNEARIQNVQELTTIWADLRAEIAENGGTVTESYAILGEYDFLVLFEARDRNHAFQVALLIERRGLDVQTMEIVPVAEFGQLVDDI
ncbi:GYD domain-containing protein [Halocatena halophila]|uniref:GYD domain-containing protein n=1 Tax=Halocatena halophila TaxID=2814576 RepID=UPI002ED59F3F